MANEELVPSAEPLKPDESSSQDSKESAAAAPPPQITSLASDSTLAEISIEQPIKGRPPLRLTPLQIAAIVLLALFTIFITWRVKKLEESALERTPASALLSKQAPEFSLPALNGETVSLADYRGKKNLVVSYWASWCGPCKVELPELREFYKQHHKADTDFEILAISIDEEKADAEKYVETEKLPFPVLLDPHSKVADSYTVGAIPTMFVVDKRGKIIYAHTGLDQVMQFQLMRSLGIKMPGIDEGEKDGEKRP